MKGLLIGLALLFAVPCWAGEKEELELKLQLFNSQAQTIELRKQLAVAKEVDEFNKRVQEFQKELDSKGYLITPDGKVAEKPKKEK